MPNEPLTLPELDALASILGVATPAEPADGIAALAWCLINRLEGARSRADEIEAIAQLLGQGDGAPVRAERESTPAVDPHIRALAYLGLALSGDTPDPTRGSTLFHRHDDWPCWARDAEPAALVGSYFFYSDPAGPAPVGAVDVFAKAG